MNQAFCCFCAKSSWVFCFKGPDCKPELSFGLLTNLCVIPEGSRAWLPVWCGLPVFLHSQPGCKVMEGEEFGICLESHSSVP